MSEDYGYADDVAKAKAMPSADMGSVQRYAYFPEHAMPRIQGCPSGEWIKHDDHARIITDLRAKLDEANYWRRNYADSVKATAKELNGIIDELRAEVDGTRASLGDGPGAQAEEIRRLRAQVEAVTRERDEAMHQFRSEQRAALANKAECERLHGIAHNAIHECESLRARLAAGEVGKVTDGGWVKCSERMPESLVYVMIQDTSGGRPFCARWFGSIQKWCKDIEDLRVDGDGTIDGDDWPGELIACWRPLPPPPKATP